MAYLITRKDKKGSDIIYICFIDPATEKERRVSLKTTDRDAAAETLKDYNAAERLELIGFPSTRKKYIPTVGEIFDKYLPFWEKHRLPRTYRDAKSHIKLTLRPALGEIRSMSLTTMHIDSMVGDMRAKYQPRTINLHLETLRKFLRKAAEDKFIPSMPCPVKLVKEPKSLPRYALPKDLNALFEKLDFDHRLRAMLSFHTGISDRDLSFIRIPEGFDRQNRMLRYRRPKTIKEWAIPLNKIAMQIMTILAKDNPGPMLFRHVSARKAYRTASRLAEVKITPHQVRHSFATSALAEGATLEQLQEILGHEDIETTRRYARVLPEYLRSAVNRVGESDRLGIDWQALLTKPRKASKTVQKLYTKKPV